MTSISHEELSVFYIVGSSTKINNALLCFHGNTLCIIVDSDMYITNMRGTHCCISMAAVVTQTCQNVMLCYVTCMLPILVTGWSIRLQKVSQDFLSMFCWTLTSFLLLLMAACYNRDQKGGLCCFTLFMQL